MVNQSTNLTPIQNQWFADLLPLPPDKPSLSLIGDNTAHLPTLKNEKEYSTLKDLQYELVQCKQSIVYFHQST